MLRLTIALCLLIQLAAGAAIRLYPVDDTERDPAFRAFVKKLRSAVEGHNSGALRKLVDNEVVVGPEDDDKGWGKFIERWHPDEEDSKVWPALSDLLSLGFIREHPRLFLSPYLVWRFPRELNRATHLVVTRDPTALRTEPSARAAVAGTLSFEIVEQVARPESGEGLGEWVRVRTSEGKTGFVSMRDVMSPLMPRAQFGLSHGKWLMIALEGLEP